MAANPQIKIGVGIDGAGITVAEGMINAFLKRIGGNASEVGKLFKEFMGTGKGGLIGTAAAFGAVAGAATLLTELGTHTAHWAHEIQEVSEQMGISTDAAQELGFAAELMGKDLNWAAQMMEKIELMAEKALGGQDKFVKLANAIGLTQTELAHLNLEDINKKFLEAIRGGKLSDAEIGRAVGVKNIRQVKSLAESEEYANKYGMKIDKDAINMMADEWRAWKVLLKDLGVVLMFVGAILVQVVRIIRKTFVAALEVLSGSILGFVALVLKAASKIPGLGHLSKTSDEYRGWGKRMLNAAGEDITGITGPKGKKDTAIDREGDFDAGKHLEKLEGNPFLKMGGLMGVDTNFRIERLTQQMVQHLANIDEHTKPMATQTAMPPAQSTLANFASVGAYASTPAGKGMIAGIRTGLGI